MPTALRLNVNPLLIQWIQSFLTAGQIQWALYTLYRYHICHYRKTLRVLYYHRLCLLCIQTTAGAQSPICRLKDCDDSVILNAFKRLLSASGALASWWKSNHLNLKVSKTKGTVIEFLRNLTLPSNLTVESKMIQQRYV